MKYKEFIERLAKRTHSTPAEAADQLDAVVHQTLHKLRRGQKVHWPGLGLFRSDDPGGVRFEGGVPAKEKKRGSK